ncbi:hypothetical protein SAMN05216490_0258 [Mucilaginibacter mallensis]|uniref:Uncharacterized protein n=1 Tax=Mucilaginibacter mallensis TaxID=652787 RepID=A0A1H1N7G4_MUCMA|nr:hypothetical protein [Mucilaginibacter mallensis]SDR94932.1 hypothetical protein SAMN05216490_0258 [Mucilaginibacter mallensis]
MFKKRNIISKLWLKYTDRAAYVTYKWDLANYGESEQINFLIGSEKLNTTAKINAVINSTGKLNLLHSGNAGDIIYALPTIKKIYETTGVHINLLLKLNQPSKIQAFRAHPLGNVMLNQKMADMLFPLIQSQEYIRTTAVYTNQVIDIDLDYFRAGFIPMNTGNIARWCSYITGFSPDLWKKWLIVTPDTDFSDTIIVARSGRYHNETINYSFINKYNNLKFIGVKSEYDDIKKFIPKIEWIEVEDFLQMARMIAGCKFFIGNQSFPYSIAEALKVPRILEVAFDVINVVPEGENGHDFFLQDHFESLVESLNAGGK